MRQPEPESVSWAGDSHLRVAFQAADDQANLVALYQALRNASIDGLQDITPAYATLLLHFDPRGLEHDHAERRVREIVSSLTNQPHAEQARLIQVPSCYDPSFAPDLEEVAALHGLTPPQLAAIHSEPEYTVRFIGFSPGFPYLDGLPAQLATPRLAAPRMRVPEGSIAIAADQTGIYPRATPGGWRLIARTPLRLFDAAAASPALLRMGDRVRFVPISIAEYERLAAQKGSSA